MPKKKPAPKKKTAAKKKPAPLGWSQRDMAAAVGCSYQHIGKLCLAGKLSKLKNGKIDESKAVDEYMAINAEVGKEGLREHNKNQKGKPKKAAKKKAPGKKAATKKQAGPKTAMDITTAFNRAKLAEKEYQAQLRELEYKKQKAELIPVEDVIRDATHTMNVLKSLLTSLPARIAPRLMQRDSIPEIQAIIDDEVRQMLKTFHESEFYEEG